MSDPRPTRASRQRSLWPQGAVALGLGMFTSFSSTGPAHAQAPEEATSVEFPNDDEPLFFAPLTLPEAARNQRRGAARLGARLPLYGSALKSGPCDAHWLLVGPQAWVCESRVRLSDWVAMPANKHTLFSDGLPFAYHYVGDDGSFGYEDLNVAEEVSPDSQLEPGFAVGIQRTQVKPEGELYGLTTHGLWIPMRDLRPARALDFQGATLGADAPYPIWVVEDKVALQDQPGVATAASARVFTQRFTRYQAFERATVRGAEYFRIDEANWLPAKSLREAKPAPPPAGLKPHERWIAVDIDQQTLVAYEGSRAVFATLVSTGRGTEGSELATPKGEFRIWVKLLSTDMTNLEDPTASRNYAIEDVPHVMFFSGGYGLHGAFWHRSFGHKRSHGCVNLAPLDAQFLFHWVGPRLPAGWRAVLPTPHDPGTRVVVR